VKSRAFIPSIVWTFARTAHPATSPTLRVRLDNPPPVHPMLRLRPGSAEHRWLHKLFNFFVRNRSRNAFNCMDGLQRRPTGFGYPDGVWRKDH
jgi:hypothetical protein